MAKAIITHGGHSDRVEPPSFRLQLFVPLASSKADCALASLNAASKAASGRPPFCAWVKAARWRRRVPSPRIMNAKKRTN